MTASSSRQGWCGDERWRNERALNRLQLVASSIEGLVHGGQWMSSTSSAYAHGDGVMLCSRNVSHIVGLSHLSALLLLRCNLPLTRGKRNVGSHQQMIITHIRLGLARVRLQGIICNAHAMAGVGGSHRVGVPRGAMLELNFCAAFCRQFCRGICAQILVA